MGKEDEREAMRTIWDDVEDPCGRSRGGVNVEGI